MAGSYRRYYLGAGATILTIFLALQLYGLQIVDLSGNINCLDTCTSYFNVINPTANSIYIYNKENIKLDFSPKIKNYELFVEYYGKWKKIDFTNETKLPNVPKDAKYVFVFPRYSTKKFKLVGYKEEWENIKWTFGTGNRELDPLWLSGTQIGDKIVKEDCEPVYIDDIERIKHYKTIDGFTYPNGTFVKAYQVLDYVEAINKGKIQVDCVKTGKVNVSGTIYNFNDFFCRLEGKEIICINYKEGGQFNQCKPDGSVTCWKLNVETGIEEFYNSLKTNLI